jgi:hypothetical protein
VNREELLKNAKPILFNTEMVQAILEGRKTVTRRVIKPQPIAGIRKSVFVPSGIEDGHGREIKLLYKVGDILYIRETWQLLPSGFDEIPPEYWYIYKATDELSDECTRWRPSIHMPKKAARIFLKVTDVRVERLQDMTDEDCIAEGIKPVRVPGSTNYREEREFQIACGIATIEKYEELWDSTIKKQDLDKYSWEANPWVWVIEFERVEVENE